MTRTQHLSMRVPWRDRPWDGHVCDRPLDNSSCVLLKGIGEKRDDDYERDHAGAPVVSLVPEQLPCLNERATFMSAHGYSVVKNHPYAKNKVLKGTLSPTTVSIPGFAFEAVPFRWMSREPFEADLAPNWSTGYEGEAEVRAVETLGFDPKWIMDGANQQAVIRAFFEPVVPHSSLVFAYLKHSPFQEGTTRKLLVGAARVTDVRLPGMWNMQGEPAFESSMWETAVSHSLRTDMRDGILLPYQHLVPLLENGIDVDDALAWEPEGRALEFSYVTEHVSDDAAIEALLALAAAARGACTLGVEVPASAFEWVDRQVGLLWQQRGPTPGLGAVLAHLGVPGAYGVARMVSAAIEDSADPWEYLDSGFADPSRFTAELRQVLGGSTARIWQRQTDEFRDALKTLSAFDITADQAAMIMDGTTVEPLPVAEFLENPYYASICTYTDPLHIAVTTIDRACYPPAHVTWTSPMPESAQMADHHDPRRVEALLVDSLEHAAVQGSTVLPLTEAVAGVAGIPVAVPCPLNEQVLFGLELDPESLPDPDEYWTALVGTTVGDGTPAYKLRRLFIVAELIRRQVDLRAAAPRFGTLSTARSAIDAAIDQPLSPGDLDEEAARTEKAAGLAELYASPLSVLIGPAGTGKTTLLRALVDLPDVAGVAPILLAPTGKARVQMQQKVGFPAHTLASHLSRSGRFDGTTGQYRTDEEAARQQADLVVIDEASMLTEEMLAATLDSFAGIKRLVLVGDPRQLPPIGAGRPFVDLVERLKPDSFESSVRVDRGYVELQVTRRQQDQDGADLALAKWFGGGELGPDDDLIWQQLTTDPEMGRIRYVEWGKRTPAEVLTDVMHEELDLTANPDVEKAFALTYGGAWNDPYLNWDVGAGAAAEKWQILTPTRSRQFGSVELNRHIKRAFRAGDTKFAGMTRKFNIANPIGPEMIVRGDKVMNTRNARMRGWPKNEGLDYVANGEIGVVIGRLKPFKEKYVRVEFSSQLDFTYSYWASSSEDPPLELAWAVTVHKSQGSEFATTFVVLPSRAGVSRELLYTALTRHTDRVVILHDGTLSELRELARPSASETAARLTDLFRAPSPQEVSIAGEIHRVDANLVHVTGTGVLVRSKNEVILADILQQVVPGQWKYEQQLVGADGSVRSPDFTIQTMLGGTVYWEHLGMLDQPVYAAKWAAKRDWYAHQGILPWSEGGGPKGSLVWTDDLGGVNVPEWRTLAEQVFAGQVAPTKRPAKKALPRRAT
ncbi:AAA family ATPase [Nocardia sp. NPDC058705]|uniref:AAA family ATPase n=1 Tax=Nocardia sp. NPDC058705 TaxID=3346609 RepID=UPI0036C977CD